MLRLHHVLEFGGACPCAGASTEYNAIVVCIVGRYLKGPAVVLSKLGFG